jgi:nitrate reductase NapAB chaperone NapD
MKKVKEIEEMKNSIKELEKYEIHKADSRCGKRIALIEIVNELGGIRNVTPYMLYDEMMCFLKGIKMGLVIKK